MPTNPNCVFCKIIAGQIPSYKIYEDEAVFAFWDIGPIVRGHCLVVPKAHHATVMETPPEVLSALHERMPRLARAVLAATETSACHILVNNGAEATQTVPHLHYHILPRYEGDGYKLNWVAGKLDSGEAGKLGEAAKQALAGDP